MRALIAGLCMLSLAASLAHADGAKHAKHASTALTVPLLPAEPLDAYPRSPVRVARLAGDQGALATGASRPDPVAALEGKICAGMTMATADCLDLVVRMSAFLDRILPSPAEAAGER